MQIFFIICDVAIVAWMSFLWFESKKYKDKNTKLEEQVEELKKAQEFEQNKATIMQEEYKNAEEKKEKLRSGTDDERFAAAFDILHNNKRN